MIRHTTWEEELAKEASSDRVREILRQLYPGAIIEDVRHLKKLGKDWNIRVSIDDKTDHLLGVTGRICLDQKTLFKKDILQLFTNPKLPGYFLLIDNNKLDPVKIGVKRYDIPRANTDEKFTTQAFVVDVFYIKDAIVACHPPLKWWLKKRRSNK